MKPKTKAQLQREISELKGQLANSYHFAQTEINKASKNHLMGSGAVVTISALGGREILSSIVIRDGLSDETIECLKSDFRESFELATLFKPKQ